MDPVQMQSDSEMESEDEIQPPAARRCKRICHRVETDSSADSDAMLSSSDDVIDGETSPQIIETLISEERLQLQKR
jgi:hypothetical protein